MAPSFHCIPSSPNSLFLWPLLQPFLHSKTFHLHENFCSPSWEGINQRWHSFIPSSLHLPIISEEEKNKVLCACFKDKRVGGEAISQFYYAIIWEKDRHVWKQQVLQGGRSAGTSQGPSQGKQEHEIKEISAEYFSMSHPSLRLVGSPFTIFTLGFRINLGIKFAKNITNSLNLLPRLP